MEKNTCPLCRPTSIDQLIWQSHSLRVIFANEAEYPGYVRVVWNEHIAEISQLSSSQRQELMSVVNLIEKVVLEVMHPKKINLAALGNMVPHIHWHVIPRYEDDATFPGSVWSEKLRQTPPERLEKRRSLESILKSRLVEVLELELKSA